MLNVFEHANRRRDLREKGGLLPEQNSTIKWKRVTNEYENIILRILQKLLPLFRQYIFRFLK